MRQAQLDAAVKFAPVHASLVEALRNARQTYGSTVQAGQSTAAATERAAHAALPEIGKIYAGANAAQQAGVTLVNQQLSQLPGVDNQFKANQASEVQGQLARMLGARTDAESRLNQQAAAGRAGAQFNQTQASQALRQTVAQLLSKNSQAAGEEGSFAADEAGKLEAEANKLAQSERQNERTTGTSRENSKETRAQQEAASERSAATSRANSQEKAKGSGPGGVKPLPTDKQVAAAKTLREIEGEARSLAHEHHTPGEIYSQLITASPAGNTPKLDPSGKPLKNSKGEIQYEKVPATKAYDALLVQAAVNSALGGEPGSGYGRVSKGTMEKLHKQGYSLSVLGLEGPSPVPSSNQQATGKGTRINAERERRRRERSRH